MIYGAYRKAVSKQAHQTIFVFASITKKALNYDSIITKISENLFRT